MSCKSIQRFVRTCARPLLFSSRKSQHSFACNSLPRAPSFSHAVHARLSSRPHPQLHIQRFPPNSTNIRHTHPHSIPPRLPDHPSTTLTASGTQPTPRSVQQNVTSDLKSVRRQSWSPHVTTRRQPQARPDVFFALIPALHPEYRCPSHYNRFSVFNNDALQYPPPPQPARARLARRGEAPGT